MTGASKNGGRDHSRPPWDEEEGIPRENGISTSERGHYTHAREIGNPAVAGVHLDKLPIPYVCVDCGATGVKLWRQYQTFLCNITLKCRRCAEHEQAATLARLAEARITAPHDEIGWRVPAIPTDDGTFWGCRAVPVTARSWWNDLPEEAP